MSWLDQDKNFRAYHTAGWWRRLCFWVANRMARWGARELLIRACVWSWDVDGRIIDCMAERPRKRAKP